MRKEADPLANVRIAAPCPASWENMAGDDRVRHCALCDLNVYNFAELTRDEIRELLARTGGRVCGRLYRRADGTLLTRDCPSGLEAVRRRVSRFASAVMAALVSVAPLGCATNGLLRSRSRIELHAEAAARSEHAVFTGMVIEPQGNPLPGVTVIVRDEATGHESTVITDSNGAFNIASLSDGRYRIEALLEGFAPAVAEHVVLSRTAVTSARIELRLNVNESVMVGGIAVSPFSNDGISTTFTQDFLEHLPK
jgi:hypothetical protein